MRPIARSSSWSARTPHAGPRRWGRGSWRSLPAAAAPCSRTTARCWPSAGCPPEGFSAPRSQQADPERAQPRHALVRPRGAGAARALLGIAGPFRAVGRVDAVAVAPAGREATVERAAVDATVARSGRHADAFAGAELGRGVAADAAA